MPDFEIKSCSRKCVATQNEIARGSAYFSVVKHDEDDNLIREDYSESAWEGPPEDCIGWWKSELPALESGKVYWAPNDVLYAYFDEVMKQSDQADRVFVMALLLIRRRLMKLEQTISDEQGKRMVLRSPRHESLIEIPEMPLTGEQIKKIQSEFGEHLFTDRATVDEDSSE